MKKFMFFMLVSICSSSASGLAWQVPPAPQPAPVAAAAAPAAAKTVDSPYLKPQVLRIYTTLALDTANSKNIIHPNYRIRILISHPIAFLEQRPKDDAKLMLYADGLPLKGMTSDYFSAAGSDYVKANAKHLDDEIWITFIFKRDSTNKEAWNTLFRLTNWKENQVDFSLSVGWEGMFPLSIANEKIVPPVTLIYYSSWGFWLLCVLYMAFLAFFIYQCSTTGLIREPDKDQRGNFGPYSLAQTQLAFWTVIICGGFIYLTLLTGLSDSLNATSLILLGISGVTTGVARFIDSTKQQKQEKVTADAIAAGTPVAAPFVKKYRSFLTDITSDGGNVTVQRTQTVLWNFILGGYFIWYVIINKSMPVFSEVLLTLAGISSLMYLTSKGPDPKTPTETPPGGPAGGVQEAPEAPVAPAPPEAPAPSAEAASPEVPVAPAPPAEPDAAVG